MARRGPITQTTSIPAPTGGWNARDAIADMPPTDAVSLVNMFPRTTTVDLRGGYAQYATGLPSQVDTLMAYAGGSTNKFKAISSGAIYDVTNGGAAGNYLSLPGTAGNYASTPDAAVLDITGDIDIICYAAAADWTPAAMMLLVSKWNTGGNQRSYNFFIQTGSTGKLVMQVSTDGTGAGNVAGTSSIAPSVVDGAGLWLRATRNVTTGDVVFYTSTDSQSTAVGSVLWVQLGATQPTTTGAAFVGTADLEVGAQNAGANNNFIGKVYSAYVYSGIGGTLAASMVANDTTPATASWASALTGETWTANGTAAIVGTREVIGLSNSRWQYQNFTTTAGSYIVMVNGADVYRVYDGTAWHKDGDGAPYDITGVTSSNLIDVHVFKSRLWFVQVNTLKAWYLPVNSIGGAATVLDLSGVFLKGGTLQAMATWTIDSGFGVDDYAVWATSKGEVAVYKLSDPTTPSGIALIGIWHIGSPVGRRCFMKFRGDNLIICQDGIMPLASALQSSRLDPRVAVSNKIELAVSTAVTNYGANYGWQLLQFPKEDMLILNVPVQEGSAQQQYVMNTINGSWCNFTGWAANCWELFNDNAYFGGNGFVGQAWSTNADAGTNIQGNALQAFSALRSPAIQKRFTRIRPTLYSNGSPTIYANVNLDLDTTDPSSPLAFSPTTYGVWDTGLWDTAVWGADLTLNNRWQGANGVGGWVAPRLKVATMGIQVQWVNTDLVYERAAGPTP